MPGPSSSCKDYEEIPIKRDDVNNIINKINERRNFVASGLLGLPQAANMNKVYWSEELAAMAQRWVDQCDAATRPDREDECRDLDDTSVGQAIVTVEGPAPGMQLKSMIDVWFMQNLDYTGSVMYYNQTRSRKTNYFTQLIWGESDRIGCGRARFYIEQKQSMIERLVCNFAPKGNVHGKPVYAVGYPGTLCQNNKTPDRKFQSLCRYYTDDGDKVFATIKPPVNSFLRILNLSNKPETDSNRNNLKQVKFDVNETSELRNQKTRHVLFNNSYAFLKNRPPSPMRNHRNYPSNSSRVQLHQHQQERGHSRVYHGHNFHDNNFEATIQNYVTQNNPTSGNYQNSENFRRLDNDDTSEQINLEVTEDLRKYNRNNQCTRRNEPKRNDCEINHKTPCTGCTRDLADNCMLTTLPCQTDTPACMMKTRHGNNCPCNSPSTPCATLPPRCQCNVNCKCFNDECANTPCPPFRRSGNLENKDETKKSVDLHYYDFLPNMAIRSGDNSKEQSPLKERFPPPERNEWIQYDTTIGDVFKKLIPMVKHNQKQVKNIFETTRNSKHDYDYIYDSSHSRERKRRSPDDITFKPFWQMDEFNRGKSTLLKSMRYTTLPNSRRIKKTKRTNPTVRLSQTTESITVKFKEETKVKEIQKHMVTEKYLSFDELMHLRKLTSTDFATDVTRGGSSVNLSPDGRRNANTPPTSTYTTNTPFMRKKHCTRKLTCTWTAPTVIGADGSVLVPGLGGDRGSKTPPGYVEGCTRTSTCTRDFMDRNKFSTISDETGSGETTLEDEDYCEKRALDVRKRDSGQVINYENDDNSHYQTSTATPYTTTIMYTYFVEDIEYDYKRTSTIPTPTLNNCICEKENTRMKRNDRKSFEPRNKSYRSNNSPSYGDLFYLVLQKIMRRWNKNQKASRVSTCFCNSGRFIRGSVVLLLFIFLYNILIKLIFI